MSEGFKAEIAKRLSDQIKTLCLSYEEQFGRKAEAVFIPGLKILALVTLAEDLCGRLLDEGFVLDSFNGLQIRLVTGNRLGVGILKGDPIDLGATTTPQQEALWFIDRKN